MPEGSHELREVRLQILKALQHIEASDGLYFRNFLNLHEEDQRPAVSASQVELLDALQSLLDDGEILMDDSGEEVIFFLNEGPHHHESF